MSTQPTIDIICAPQRGSLTCLTRGNTAGLSIVVTASLLSLGSVVYAFFFIVVVNWRSSTRFRIFYSPMDILVFALLFADLVQAVGGLLSLKWIRDGRLQTGVFCDAQGILETLGETGVALTTLLIAIYTFVGVSAGRGLDSMRITLFLAVGVWIFIGILIGAGYAANKHVPYMSPVPYWCWVGSSMTWKLVAQYLWMWISLFTSCLLYIPLCLWMSGNLVFHKWYVWSFQWTFSDADVRSGRRRALVMLMYPIAYCVCILPLSAVRWKTFKEEAKYGTTSVSMEWTFAVMTIFSLSGFFNVILVLTTRPNLGLFGQHEELSSGRPPSPSAIDQLRRDRESEIEGVPMEKLSSQANPTNPRRQRV